MFRVRKFSQKNIFLTETGGLLRVAVKLMMACASQNTNVFVVSLPIT